MAKHDNQKDGLEIKPGMTIGKATHDEWVKHKSFEGGHVLADDNANTDRGSTSEKGKGADGAGTGTFNESVRPVK